MMRPSAGLSADARASGLESVTSSAFSSAGSIDSNARSILHWPMNRGKRAADVAKHVRADSFNAENGKTAKTTLTDSANCSSIPALYGTKLRHSQMDHIIEAKELQI